MLFSLDFAHYRRKQRLGSLAEARWSLLVVGKPRNCGGHNIRPLDNVAEHVPGVLADAEQQGMEGTSPIYVCPNRQRRRRLVLENRKLSISLRTRCMYWPR